MTQREQISKSMSGKDDLFPWIILLVSQSWIHRWRNLRHRSLRSYRIKCKVLWLSWQAEQRLLIIEEWIVDESSVFAFTGSSLRSPRQLEIRNADKIEVIASIHISRISFQVFSTLNRCNSTLSSHKSTKSVAASGLDPLQNVGFVPMIQLLHVLGSYSF